MNFSSPIHERHHSASSSRVLRPFQRTESADVMRPNEPISPSILSSNGRRRPGSESDVLDAKAAEVSLHHQDSLMLAYHQRPSVVASHNTTSSVSGSAAARQVSPVYVWTTMEVGKWLKKHLLSSQRKYIDLFLQHDINGKTLLLLNDSKLKRMGIDEGIDRTGILNEILKLQMKNYMQYFKGLESAGNFDLR